MLILNVFDTLIIGLYCYHFYPTNDKRYDKNTCLFSQQYAVINFYLVFPLQNVRQRIKDEKVICELFGNSILSIDENSWILSL